MSDLFPKMPRASSGVQQVQLAAAVAAGLINVDCALDSLSVLASVIVCTCCEERANGQVCRVRTGVRR